jgi:hypothetical protein
MTQLRKQPAAKGDVPPGHQVVAHKHYFYCEVERTIAWIA